MSLKSVLTFIAILILLGCRPGKEEKILQEFSEEYTGIKNTYEERVSGAESLEQIKTYRVQKATDCQQLLEKYGEQVSSDGAELLKSKLEIDISRFDEAEQRIARLIEDNSSLINEAKLVKVQLLIYRNKPGDALAILREIQDKLIPGPELVSVYLYFTLYSRDSGVIEEYARKFLDSPAIPRSLSQYTPDVYRALSFAALLKSDREGALAHLEKAISETADREKKLKWQSQLAQLQTLGTPAIPLSAETWLNSNPIEPAQLNNKVTLIAFWAPWSNHCRQAIPGLVHLNEKYKDKGLVVIGLTKLYGHYKDDAIDKGVLGDKDEILSIKEFLARFQVTYPVAVSMEAVNSENYKIETLPTLVFIDKKGKIAHILAGTWPETFLEDKINRLLEES